MMVVAVIRSSRKTAPSATSGYRHQDEDVRRRAMLSTAARRPAPSKKRPTVAATKV
jgi:hypothetical protein